jgi:hypothetical protein
LTLVDSPAVLDSVDALVVWRGPAPQIVTTALGREVVLALDSVPLADLAEDLESLGLGERPALRAALAGLVQLLAAEGVPLLAAIDPADDVDTTGAARFFLQWWEPSGRSGAGSPVPKGEAPVQGRTVDPSTSTTIEWLGLDPQDLVVRSQDSTGSPEDRSPQLSVDDAGPPNSGVVVAAGGGRVLVSVAGIHQCAGIADDHGRGVPDAVADAVLIAAATKAGLPVVTTISGSDGATLTPVSGAATSLGVIAELGGAEVRAEIGFLDSPWRVRVADGSVRRVGSIQVPVDSGAVLQLVPGDRTDGPPWIDGGGGASLRPEVRLLDPPNGAMTTYEASFRSAAGGLLDGAPSSRSVKIAPGAYFGDRQLWALGPTLIGAIEASGWSELLAQLGAPSVVAGSNIDLRRAQEVLVGYEVDDGRVTHKLYMVGMSTASYATVAAALGVRPTRDAPTFLSLKWSPGDGERWWTADYRPPPPGLTALRAVEQSFPRLDDWRWMHTLLQLAAPAVVHSGPDATAPVGWSTTMHAANILVMRDSLGRRSVDLRARRTERPEDVWPVLSWLSGVAGLDAAQEAHLLRFGSTAPIERAIGGTSGDGRPFVSIYRASSVEGAS